MCVPVAQTGPTPSAETLRTAGLSASQVQPPSMAKVLSPGSMLGGGSTYAWDQATGWQNFAKGNQYASGLDPSAMGRQALDEGLSRRLTYNPDEMRGYNQRVADLQAGRLRPSWEVGYWPSNADKGFRYDINTLPSFSPEQIAASEGYFENRMIQDEEGARMEWVPRAGAVMPDMTPRYTPRPQAAAAVASQARLPQAPRPKPVVPAAAAPTRPTTLALADMPALPPPAPIVAPPAPKLDIQRVAPGSLQGGAIPTIAETFSSLTQKPVVNPKGQRKSSAFVAQGYDIPSVAGGASSNLRVVG